MLKLSYLLILIFTVSLNAQVSQDEAAIATVKWFSQAANREINSDNISKTQSFNHKEEILFYSFEFKGGGFVIVSADKRTRPILGYSTTNHFLSSRETGDKIEINTLPSSPVKELLTEYANQFDVIKSSVAATENDERNKLFKRGSSIVHTSNDVEPLTDALWGQGYPYNIYCPLLSTRLQQLNFHCPNRLL